jgi:hypothetical protein
MPCIPKEKKEVCLPRDEEQQPPPLKLTKGKWRLQHRNKNIHL